MRKHVLSLAVFLTISWQQVTTDCLGGPEPYVSYREVTAEIRLAGEHFDPATGGMVPDYDKRITIYDIPYDPAGTPTSVTVQVPRDPAVGEVAYIADPIAIDDSGNRSDQPCTSDGASTAFEAKEPLAGR